MRKKQPKIDISHLPVDELTRRFYDDEPNLLHMAKELNLCEIYLRSDYILRQDQMDHLLERLRRKP